MKKPSLLVIFLTIFIDLIGFGIVLPLLPRYSERFGAEGFMIGLIIASFSIMQFFFAPVWGRLSDRIGRRPVILISTAGSSISYALFALASAPALSATSSLVILLASRVFAGICGANISVASAYMADVTPPEQRSRGMGMIGMAFGLGFILGPVIGAVAYGGFSVGGFWGLPVLQVFKGFGLPGPGWVASAICAANFFLATVVLVESRKPDSAPATSRATIAQWVHALKTPTVGFLVTMYFLGTFAFACFESTLPLLLGSPSFHPDDFKAPAALSQKIISAADPVSVRVRSLLPVDSLKVMGRADTSESALRREWFNASEALLKSRGLFDANTWQQINLRPETVKLSTSTQNSESLKRFNRLLLEDAYPAELKRQRFYFDERNIGYLFAFCGLMSALVQGGMIGRLVKLFGEPKLIWVSFILVAISLAIIPYAGTVGVLLIGLALVSMASGLNRAPTLGLISIHTPDSEQGAILGVTQSAGTLGRIFGPLFATTAYKYLPHSPYLGAAALCLMAGLLSLRKLRKVNGARAEAKAA